MEPMTLGTPSNSGPSSPATTPTGSPYLPSFLLGEPTSPLPGSTSPQTKRMSINEYNHYTSPRFPTSQSTHYQTSAPDSLSGTSEKTSGPPIRGLFETVTSPVTKPKKPSSDANSYISSVSRQFQESRTTVPANETADSTWVTVFGYPPAAVSFILTQLATCGHIISREVPASGNWMHVQFSSKLEAKRALACNGKVYSGNVMLGVMPCRDPTILEKSIDYTAGDSTLGTTAPFASPRSPRSPGPFGDRTVDATLYESPYGSPRISQARPLVTRHDQEIYGTGNTPQKSSGIVSKAMEYILGW